MSCIAATVKNRNVNYCGEPGNSVSATVVTLYRALTISNTFSKRPHKPHNTSKNVEHIDQEPFCVKYWNKNNDGLDQQIFVKFAKVLNNIFQPFDIIEFARSLSLASNQNSLKSKFDVIFQ